MPDDLIRLPGGVDLDKAETSLEARVLDDLLHLPLGGDVLLRPVKQQVGKLDLGGLYPRGRSVTGEVTREPELGLVTRARGVIQPVREQPGEQGRVSGHLSPGAQVGLRHRVVLEAVPPGIHAPEELLVIHHLLEAVHQPVHGQQVGVVDVASVDLCRPPVLRIPGVMEILPPPEITLSGQQQLRLKLLSDEITAADTNTGEGDCEQEDGTLKQSGGEELGVEFEECCGDVQSGAAGVLLACRAMGDAGHEAISVVDNPLLIEDKPGHEPGHLEDVDAAEGDGRGHAE